MQGACELPIGAVIRLHWVCPNGCEIEMEGLVVDSQPEPHSGQWCATLLLLCERGIPAGLSKAALRESCLCS